MRRVRHLLVSAALAASASVLGGCAEDLRQGMIDNQPPVVRLTAAPPTYAQGDRYFYNVALNWTAFDPDGRVDYFLIAVIDLPGQQSRTELPPDSLVRYTGTPNWVRTSRRDTVIQFRSTFSRRDTVWADDSHVFLIKAVDNQGAESEIEQRAFFSNTIAPEVWINSPRPSTQSRAFVSPAVLIRFDGIDRDGVFTKKPVKYKYTLLSDQTPVTLAAALTDLDSVRRYFAPRHWAGWDSTSADTQFVQYTNLVPNRDYMFVVVAFDEAGAYSPFFRRDQNMLLMRVTFAGNNLPTITMFNEFFQYTYPGGSYEPTNPQRVIPLEIPADQPITINWFATPTQGSDIRSYRWALDIQDLNDETPREFPDTDLHRWSAKLRDLTTATIGPFPGGGSLRTFFIEAEDINGFKSLGMIGMTVVRPAWQTTAGARPLLVVKDYRFAADRKSNPSQTCVNPPPAQAWPTNAELDSFLFARGGYPWRCYPSGGTSGGAPTTSVPGILKGFDFDTISTVGVDLSVRLSRLASYRHVVWLTDGRAATLIGPGNGNASDAMTSIRFMTGPNRSNTLATYVRMGGKVWAAGGGVLEASLVDYDRTNNNGLQPAPGRTYAFDNNELVPGRFMYDIFRWQSEVKPTSGFVRIRKLLGRNAGDPFYAELPASLDYKSEAAGDTFPPGRFPLFETFYSDISFMEYLSRPNGYLEDLDPGPGENFVSALDTLYEASGISLVPTNVQNPTNFNNVCMTVYPARSRDASPDGKATAIFSGFDIWSYQKTQLRQLTRFVLHNLWGLDPNATLRPPAAAARATPALHRAAPPAAAPGPGGRPVRTGDGVRSGARPARTAAGSGR